MLSSVLPGCVAGEGVTKPLLHLDPPIWRVEMLSLLMFFLGFMVKIICNGCINARKKIWVIWSTPKLDVG